MSIARRQPAPDAVWEQPDGEVICLLCGAVVGETYGPRIVHRASCDRPLQWLSGRPRCCYCGGPLICEPTAEIWGAGPQPATGAGS
jgi:hypothetical protein